MLNAIARVPGPTSMGVGSFLLNWEWKEFMRRFTTNRSWTLIPALCLSLALIVMAVTDLRAQTRDYYDDNGGGGAGSSPPTASGDPDMPGATIKGGGGQGRAGQVRYSATSSRSAGDSRLVASDWKWVRQVVLRGSLRFFVRF